LIRWYCTVSEHIEITASYVLAVDDGNAYLEAGLAGLGVIALPVYMAAAHQACGSLIPLFEDWRIDQCPCTGISAEPPCQRQTARFY
jgi:DNA-binding transcriptional LysR family regulator